MAWSIFRPAAYADFARRKGGRALLYLILIALPLALTGAGRLGVALYSMADQAAQAIAGAPDFRIVDGRFEFDAPQPYVLMADGQELGVIDTTGATDDSYLGGRESGILILADRIIVKNGAQEQQTRFADLAPLTGDLDRAGLSAFLGSLGGWAWPLGILWVIGSIGCKLLAALVVGLFALILISARSRAGGWTAAWNIACHALTLSLLLSFVKVLAMAEIRLFGLVYWGAAAVYAVAGTSVLPRLAVGQAAVPPAGDPPAGGPTA